MRIAFFVSSFPEISETFILYQITGLIDAGHEVDIFSEGKPKAGSPVHPDVAKYKLIERTTYFIDHIPEASGFWEMPVWPANGETWLPGQETPLSNLDRLKNALPVLIDCLKANSILTAEVLDRSEYGIEAESLSALYRLYFLSRIKKKYEIIHAHFGPVGNTFRFVKQLWNVPMVVTFHGYDFSSYPLKHGGEVYKTLFNRTNAVTVNSLYAASRLKELGCPEHKIHRLNVGIKIREFSFKERKFNMNESIRLLTVGRLVEKKGIEYSLKAVAKLKVQFPQILYEIIGDGPLKDQLSKLIENLGLQNQVILHGAQNASFVQSKMSEAHVFILTSITSEQGDQEGTPVSLMEAQASGLPVISTIHSGIPEIVLNAKSGFLVKEKDTNEIAIALKHLFTNPSSLALFGNNGRSHMENDFDLEKLNIKLAMLYQQMIKPIILKNKEDEKNA